MVSERQKMKAQEIKQRNRQFVIRYLLDHPCINCGQKDVLVLDFDHNGNKESDISSLLSRPTGLSTIKNEIAKCSVRCTNCHRIKTAAEQRTYRYLYVIGEPFPMNSRKATNEVRKYVIEYLQQHSCIDCGETNILVLDFDHIRDKVLRIADMVSSHAPLVRIKDEINKCVVRCSNCHRRKSLIEQGTSYKLRISDVLSFVPTPNDKSPRNVKLNRDDILGIREDWATGKYTCRDLAGVYEVSASTISYVVRGKVWSKVV